MCHWRVKLSDERKDSFILSLSEKMAGSLLIRDFGARSIPFVPARFIAASTNPADTFPSCAAFSEVIFSTTILRARRSSLEAGLIFVVPLLGSLQRRTSSSPGSGSGCEVFPSLLRRKVRFFH